MRRCLGVALILLLVAFVQGRTLLETEEACAIDGKCGPKTPEYEVLGHHGATEIREYANATWAVSFGRSILGVDVAAALATKGLFKYFAGENNQHLRIPPSIPLITTILKKPHPPHHGPHPPHPPHNGSEPHHDDEPDFEMGDGPEFPDPEDHRGHNHSHHHHPPGPPPPPPGPPAVASAAFIPLEGVLPKPDGPRVKLVHTNTTKVYAHSFGGWAISWVVPREIDHLREDLKDLGLKPCKGKFFVATYDGPWKILGRHNEVWWAELPKGKHHHNKTVEISEEGYPIGFEAMDPISLFPDEMEIPELPEPVKREEAFADVEEKTEGEWTTMIGQAYETS